MEPQVRNEVRALSEDEMETVVGGTFLAELGKIALGWAVGKILDSGGGTHPWTAAQNMVAWQKSLK